MVERALCTHRQPTSTSSLRADAPLRCDRLPGQTPSLPDVLLEHVDLNVPLKQARQDVVTEFEQAYVEALLEKHNFNVLAAARAAGLDRMTLHKMIVRLGIERGGRGQ